MTPATLAPAHLGHLGEAAAHDHWIAGAAIGIAVGLGLWGWLKGDDEAPEEEAEEAPAEEQPA
ncbi:DUF6732 family protein [Jannaschia sp. W003]|uniref:DUF6732 family protein n=1 Tax=Jannaschia sp. W003 TaxID=2867012 RepID=UPI0021A67C7B|nr:DUF6732 family protein [Jannaschia sp. W003]UWQ22309.1 hypothetical protein K3554_04550 [Jannaschia sp. W003]